MKLQVTLQTTLLAALAFCALPLGSQEGPREPPEVLATALGWLEFRGQEITVPLSYTNEGALLALAPIVRTLGGTLRQGPLGQSHRLELLESEYVMGPESWVVTTGQEIIPISQPPIPTTEGLQVPVDFLQYTYGDALGYAFRWYSGERRLEVGLQPPRDLPIEVDRLHSLGVTTLVLQFPELPRYRIHRRPGLIEIEMIGDRLRQRWRPARFRDPLVKRMEIDPDRVRIWLGSEAVAADPYVLRNPHRLVFDISRQLSRPAPVTDRRIRQPGTIRTIVIDPGHGGRESGAIGKSGSEEKDLSLILAQVLRARLEARLPVKVVLTRSEDVDLPLETRTALANQHKADLFISLHLNSSVGPQAHGTETYFLSLQASDAGAASAAAVENQGGTAPEESSEEEAQGTRTAEEDLYGLQLILWDLAQSHHLAESQRLANLIQEELNQALGLRNRGVKQAPFRVLMGATMPAVLVELGFLSNPEEEAKLLDPAYRNQLVDALLRAVFRYRLQAEQREAEGR